MAKRMNICFDISYIAFDGRWRMPGSWPGRTFPDVEMYEEIARIAERGRLDMLFSGDGTGIPSTWRGSPDAAVHWGISWPRQDMTPLMAAMSRVTKHLGFCMTHSTTFMHPYYIARLLNSLDHLTGGRIALNLITSTRRADAANFGFDELMEHSARYDRMEEFVEVCRGLWDGVERDAMVWDHASGQVAHPEKIHPLNHEGRFFKVRGPLNTPPSPQGRPVLVQAGGSARGIRAAAYVADVAFAAAMALPLQVKQRAALDEAVVAMGRDPSRAGIVWQMPMIVAETESEAQAHRESLRTMITKEGAGAYLSNESGYDFSTLPEKFRLDDLNAEIIATQASPISFVAVLAHELGGQTEITRDQFFEHGMRNASHYDVTFAGTAAQAADHLEERFETLGSRGGFMLGHPVSMPGDLENITNMLIPELQRRGRFRQDYSRPTLRETLFDIYDD